VGIDYETPYRNVRKLWFNDSRSLAWVEARQDDADHENTNRRSHILYPPLADSVLQVIAAIPQDTGTRTPLPFSLGMASLPAALPLSFYVLAERTRQGRYDIQLIDPDGFVFGRFDRLEVRAAPIPFPG